MDASSTPDLPGLVCWHLEDDLRAGTSTWVLVPATDALAAALHAAGDDPDERVAAYDLVPPDAAVHVVRLGPDGSVHGLAEVSPRPVELEGALDAALDAFPPVGA